jgi:hypothetical protein
LRKYRIAALYFIKEPFRGTTNKWIGVNQMLRSLKWQKPMVSFFRFLAPSGKTAKDEVHHISISDLFCPSIMIHQQQAKRNRIEIQRRHSTIFPKVSKNEDQRWRHEKEAVSHNAGIEIDTGAINADCGMRNSITDRFVFRKWGWNIPYLLLQKRSNWLREL